MALQLFLLGHRGTREGAPSSQDLKSGDHDWSNWTCGVGPSKKCVGQLLTRGDCYAVADAKLRCVADESCAGLHSRRQLRECHLLVCTELAVSKKGHNHSQSSCIQRYMPRAVRLDGRSSQSARFMPPNGAMPVSAFHSQHLFVPMREPTSPVNSNFFINLDEQPARPHTGATMPHFLAVVAVIQNEAAYLPEWIEYHSLRGVSQFYLYDDVSTDRDQLEAVLAPYRKAQLVTLHNLSLLQSMGHPVPDAMEFDHPLGIAGCTDTQWHFRRGDTCYRPAVFGQQILAVRHATLHHGKSCEWMAWIDVDEFLIFEEGGPYDSIGALLQSLSVEGVGGIQVYDQVMVPLAISPLAPRVQDGLVLESTTAVIPMAPFSDECTNYSSPPNACRGRLWSIDLPGYWPDGVRQPKVDKLPNHIAAPFRGSGWWAKCIVRPQHVAIDAWATIHQLPLLPPARYGQSNRTRGLQMAHFRYRNFADRTSRSYATSATKSDKGQSKRDTLRYWKEELDLHRHGQVVSQLEPRLLTWAGRVRLAVLKRFANMSDTMVASLPVLVQRQVEAGRRFSNRQAVVLVGEARSGTTFVGRAFDGLSSFLYLYEPCRQISVDTRASDRLAPGRLHEIACADFVVRALACRLTLSQFESLYADEDAFRRSWVGRDVLQQHQYFSVAPALVDWTRKCMGLHAAAKVIRIDTAGSLQALRRFSSGECEYGMVWLW